MFSHRNSIIYVSDSNYRTRRTTQRKIHPRKTPLRKISLNQITTW